MSKKLTPVTPKAVTPQLLRSRWSALSLLIVAIATHLPFAANAVVGSQLPTPVILPTGPAPYTMYRYTAAAEGQCLPPAMEEPKDVLKRNGITIQGQPTKKEVEALAQGIAQVETLLGRPIPKSWHGPFQFIDTATRTHWNQGGDAIHVRRPHGSEGGANIARLMHEFGHRVGNSGEYERYRRFTDGKVCPITGYAKSKFNEQFAEVFSAFVTFPDLLEAKCPQAYKFFATKLFIDSKDAVATCKPTDEDEDRGTSRLAHQDHSIIRKAPRSVQ